MKHAIIIWILGSHGILVLLFMLVGFGAIDFPFVNNDSVEDNSDATSMDVGALQQEHEVIHAPVHVGTDISTSEKENITVYDRQNQGVVNISTERVAYNWFLEPIPRRGSTGSGAIIDSSGHVLTNYHVIQNATQIFITLADGDRYMGTVVGTDAENDIAILKFNPQGKNLVIIPFGASTDLQVGMKVLAIGNPFGLDRTLTTGIISGLNRPVRVSQNLVVNNMIQTDASINPGNSGGPLLNTAGDLIGINTAIFSPSGGSIGIGFAVPVDTAKRVMNELINIGKVTRGWIDIVPRQLFPQLVQYAKLPIPRGILISEITEGGNADRAGLRGGSKKSAVRYGRTIIYIGGDIITAIDGSEVTDIASLYAALEESKPGQSVVLHYVRNGIMRQTTVVLTERPQSYQWE